MNDVAICLKQYLTVEDCREINILKNECTEEEDIFLKVELEFKLNLSLNRIKEGLDHVNEFLYYDRETLVGYLGLLSMNGETGELTGMVHPSYRRQGIFTRLYNLAIEESRRRGFKRVLLVCDNMSSSGQAFMRAKGAEYSFSEYEMKLEGNRNTEEAADIALRKARNSESEEIARQNYIYFGDTSSTKIMPEDEEKQNRFTYMIEMHSKVIGKLRIDINGDSGYIGGFGILPEYRGQGIGRQSLRAALNLLGKNNIHNVALEVAAHNKNALNLYKSCGFIEESVIDYYEVK